MSRLLPLALVLFLALPARAGGTIWLVNPEGTGDVPTIEAAVAAAADGDIIELADGVFRGEGNRDFWVSGRVLVIRSASADAASCVIDAEGGDGVLRRVMKFWGTGPGFVLQDVTLTGGTALDEGMSVYGGALFLDGSASPTITGCNFVGNRAGRGGAIFLFDNCSPTILGCTFVDNVALSYGGAISMTTGCSPAIAESVFRGNSAAAYGGALSVWNGATPTMVDCTFWGNSAPDGGSAAWCRWGGAPSFVNSILAGAPAGNAVSCESGDGDPALFCSDVFGNAGGDWVDCLEGLDASNGNMSADPLFCDAGAGDLRLQWGSPCLPAHSGSCGGIGVFGPGNCASLDLEPSTFGRIKASYRD